MKLYMILLFILFRSTSIQYRGVSYTILTWHRNWQKKSLCLKSLFRWLNEVNGQIIQHVFLILKRSYFLTLIFIFHHIGKDFKLSFSTLGKWLKICFKKRYRAQKSISRKHPHFVWTISFYPGVFKNTFWLDQGEDSTF